MALRDVFAADPARDAALQFLDHLLGSTGTRHIAVRLWDGTVWGSARGRPLATLVIKHPGALRALLQSPTELSLGEMYIFDELDVEGDMEAIFPAIDHVLEHRWGIIDRIRYAALLQQLPAPGIHRVNSVPPLQGAVHSKQRDVSAVRYHYDVSNDFYALWLDRNMLYSCAYFNTAADTLEDAQEQKLNYLCRKLRLKPGERLLDLGCGWGGLILHAAKHFGAHALGITLSQRQAQWANRRIRDEGLSGRCRAEVRDYRELAEAESFDKIVSVGMFEHVGEKLLPEYFRRAWTLLRRGGAFLNHGIARNIDQPNHGASFIARYVFPDGELVPVSTALTAAEKSGWEIRDVESWREHYVITLRLWLHSLEANAARARAVVGDVKYRIWRLYMAGCAHAFRSARNNLYQTLMVKPDAGNSRLPLRRDDWYR